MPPFSNDEMLKKIKSDYLCLLTENKKIFINNDNRTFNAFSCENDNDNPHYIKRDGEESIFYYKPLICSFKYDESSSDGEDGIDNSDHNAILFINSIV